MPRMKLRHLATVKRQTPGAKDRSGVPTEAWTTVGEPVKVLRQRTSGKEVSTPAGQTVVADHLIFAGPQPPFTGDDRLVIDGVTYDLLAVDPDVAGRGHHSEALARTAATLGTTP